MSENVEDKLIEEGLRFQPHTVVTEDGYKLTLIHLSKVIGKGPDTSISPVLLHHGNTMDGFSWFDTQHESLPSLLIQ